LLPDKMKRIFIVLTLLFFVSFVSAQLQSVPLSSVINSGDLTQINNNLNFIKSNYGADIEFVIDGSDGPVMKNALYEFSDFIAFHNESDWNTVVYYNLKQNQLRFVTRKDCDFIYNYLKQLKTRNFISNVLNENSPSKRDISSMFLQISEDFKNTAQSLNENTCSSSEGVLKLRDNEYKVPSYVLGAVHYAAGEVSLEQVRFTPVLGFCVNNGLPSNSFDFLPFVNSPKKKFYSFLKDEAGYDTPQIDAYYNLLSSPGVILLNEDQSSISLYSTLFHERIHRAIDEDLTNQERSVLEDARNKFLASLKSVDTNYNLIGQTESSPIYNGNWEEIYAHMAQLQKYPSEQYYDRYIDERVYTMFAQQYPQAYQIYQKIYNIASN